MSRPPKPTSILKLTGGYRPDRHGDRMDSEAVEITGELEAPGWMDETARVEWSRVTAILSPLGVITGLDRAVLTAYCVSWSRWVEAEAGVAERGLIVEGHRGVLVPNPLLRVSRDSRDAMLKAAIKLGLSPVDRAALQIPATYSPDPLDGLLAKRDGIKTELSK